MANGAINTYLYSLAVQCDAGGWATYEIRWYILDAGFVPTAQFVTAWAGIVDSAATIADRAQYYQSPYPLWQRINPGAFGPYFQPFLIITGAQVAGTNNLFVNAALGFDQINDGIPGDIGEWMQPTLTVVNPATF